MAPEHCPAAISECKGRSSPWAWGVWYCLKTTIKITKKPPTNQPNKKPYSTFPVNSYILLFHSHSALACCIIDPFTSYWFFFLYFGAHLMRTAVRLFIVYNARIKQNNFLSWYLYWNFSETAKYMQINTAQDQSMAFFYWAEIPLRIHSS